MCSRPKANSVWQDTAFQFSTWSLLFMCWYSPHQLIALLFDILRVVWQPLDQKDLEIQFLLQQLAVVCR